jgi:hypothetical protein
VEFSHEWLVPIGASTKTAHGEGRFAGHFGEGFKVAALCAIRDLHWRISAGSRDWRIVVTTAPLCIDGRRMQSLAYLVREGLGPGSDAWLRLEGLNGLDKEVLEHAVRWSFFYPENPLLGEPIWGDARTALFRRSKAPLPPEYPGGGATGHGVLFTGWQARGTHELPFAVGLHDLRDADRERGDYYDFQVVDALAEAARRLPPSPSRVLLEATRRRWADCRKTKYECGTWEPVVRRLAENVANDPPLAKTWRGCHPELLVLERLPRGSTRARNRRMEARAWMHASGGGCRLVQGGFRALGYPTLEEACEAAGGYLAAMPPTPDESRRITLLLAFVRDHFLDLLPLEPLPRVEVMDGLRPGLGGLAVCHPRRGGPHSSRGRRVRYELSSIALTRRDLGSKSPRRAFATMLHELAHAFGTDGSSAFSAALTDLLERAAGLPRPLSNLARQWASNPKLQHSGTTA